MRGGSVHKLDALFVQIRACSIRSFLLVQNDWEKCYAQWNNGCKAALINGSTNDTV